MKIQVKALQPQIRYAEDSVNSGTWRRPIQQKGPQLFPARLAHRQLGQNNLSQGGPSTTVANAFPLPGFVHGYPTVHSPEEQDQVSSPGIQEQTNRLVLNVPGGKLLEGELL
ncbi:hypothetical protein MYX84_03115 [Acidobacteria bacterium AH-259-O06]|nr:hypothetical protein [Acidobacteria bacterium AH-259-O06]